VPYLIALAAASNVGSVATLTGNPQNMLVGSYSGVSSRAFLLAEAPVALVGLAAVFLAVWLTYHRRLPPALAPVGPDERLALHYPLMWKTGAVALVMLAGFLAGVPIALVAIAGAAYTLITRRVKPEKVYAEINWGLLVLFAGLFVVIGAVEDSGSPRISSPWRAGPTSTSRPSSSP
jgi:Na+/H+ antiporter NhaD/arsenite permease-like protein